MDQSANLLVSSYGFLPSSVTLVSFLVLALVVLFAVAYRRIAAQARQLRLSEERHRLLFDRSLAGVYESTLDGRLLDCNDAFAAILGFATREECLTRQVLDLYSTPAEREPFLNRIRQEQRLQSFEACLQRRDGSRIWVLENASLLGGKDGGSRRSRARSSTSRSASRPKRRCIGRWKPPRPPTGPRASSSPT